MRKNAFTLLEVIMAITILTVAVGASYALIQRTLIAASISQSRLVAAYLAQEGIEMVRNVRDSNWLRQRYEIIEWDDGLTGCSSGDGYCCEKDFSEANLTQLSACAFGNLSYLNIDDYGRYVYSTQPLTSNFKRKIVINKISDDILEVSVFIYWESRGMVYSIDPVVEHLYNWY